MFLYSCNGVFLACHVLHLAWRQTVKHSIKVPIMKISSSAAILPHVNLLPTLYAVSIPNTNTAFFENCRTWDVALVQLFSFLDLCCNRRSVSHFGNSHWREIMVTVHGIRFKLQKFRICKIVSVMYFCHLYFFYKVVAFSKYGNIRLL